MQKGFYKRVCLHNQYSSKYWNDNAKQKYSMPVQNKPEKFKVLYNKQISEALWEAYMEKSMKNFKREII